jgi:hypothetical protein
MMALIKLQETDEIQIVGDEYDNQLIVILKIKIMNEAFVHPKGVYIHISHIP